MVDDLCKHLLGIYRDDDDEYEPRHGSLVLITYVELRVNDCILIAVSVAWLALLACCGRCGMNLVFDDDGRFY